MVHRIANTNFNKKGVHRIANTNFKKKGVHGIANTTFDKNWVQRIANTNFKEKLVSKIANTNVNKRWVGWKTCLSWSSWKIMLKYCCSVIQCLLLLSWFAWLCVRPCFLLNSTVDNSKWVWSGNTSKTCVKRPLKNKQNKDLNDKW